MAENRLTSHAGSGTAETSTMQAANDSNLMSYMGATGTEEEGAEMDDMQFMDALIDNESSFVDTTEPGNTSQLMPMDGTYVMPSSTISKSTSSLQQQQHQQAVMGAPVALNQPQQQQQQVMTQYQQPMTQYQQPMTSFPQPGTAMPMQQVPMQQHLKATDGSGMTQSPLTARLNYPFSNAAGNPTFSVQAPPAPQSTAPGGTGRRDPVTELLSESKKRSRLPAPPVSEDEGDKVKRRMDRNQREQQRSQKITEQIACLKELLAGANVHFKPDKHSTLITVADYIKQLQTRSQLLDSEHKKLLETISKTNEAVNTPHYQTSTDGETVVSNDLLSDVPSSLLLEDEHAVFVRGLDYRNVFLQCSIPLAVASIDGRFMDCNAEFESITGYVRDELLLSESGDSDGGPKADSIPSDSGVPSCVTTTSKRNLSLFNLLCREDMEQVFLAMSRMLKQPIALDQQTNSPNHGSSAPRHHDFWSGRVSQSRRMRAKVSLSNFFVDAS
jgi:PAS domain-containing protein